MFMLTLIWSVALALLVIEGLAAFVHARHDGESSLYVHAGSLRGFISGEVYGMVRAVYAALYELLPHGQRAIFVVSVHGRRASDMFVKRVFGRMEMKRGTASSFFLKHLAEHREMDRRSSSEKQGL